MKAMILAAGFGRRMVPLTLARAKPALPFLNRPLLLRQIDFLGALGVRETVINMHHLPGSLLDLLRPEGGQGGHGPFEIGGMRIHVSLEARRLGTSGGVRAALNTFRGGETFLCVNADMVLELDLPAALAAHRRSGADATLVLIPEPSSEFNPVFHDGRRLLGFGPGEAPQGARSGTFTGVHLLEPRLLERLPEGTSEFVPDLYAPLIKEGRPPAVYESRDRWWEVGTAERYIDLQAAALTGPALGGQSHWPKGTDRPRARGVDQAALSATSMWGEGCSLGAGAVLGEGAILGDRVVVGAGARVARAVIMEGAEIGEGAVVEMSAVGPGTRIPAGAVLARALVQADGEWSTDEARPARRWEEIWRADF
jgi:NDP-sugar pyrophosphorylase family protein